MGQGRKWTDSELDYLQDKWGSMMPLAIAKKLNRSLNAVIVKSKRLGLHSPMVDGEYLTARKVSELMGVDIHTVTDYWIPKCGLKGPKKVVRSTRKIYMIKFTDLIEWLKNNQDKWDSRRVELYALGMEYEWLINKRKIDNTLPKQRAQKWTPQEDAQAIIMFKQGKKHKEIAALLGRTVEGVERRISRLDIWGTGKYIPEPIRNEIKITRTKKRLQNKLISLLKIRFNALNFDGYWQKDACMNWNNVRGCTADENNCDSCTSFIRIQPQYCARCGKTFYERRENKFCVDCRQTRKKQAQRKWAALNRRVI